MHRHTDFYTFIVKDFSALHQPQTSVYDVPGDLSLYPGLSGSYMSSPAPILVNPPPMPTYSYGIPPYPMPMMQPPGHAPFIQSHASLPLMMGPKQSPGLRRAGSINAKIFNAEARCVQSLFHRVMIYLCFTEDDPLPTIAMSKRWYSVPECRPITESRGIMPRGTFGLLMRPPRSIISGKIK